MGPTQRVIVGLSGGPDVKYSSYTKYPENLVLITNLFFNLRQMEAVLPERMETSAHGGYRTLTPETCKEG